MLLKHTGLSQILCAGRLKFTAVNTLCTMRMPYRNDDDRQNCFEIESLANVLRCTRGAEFESQLNIAIGDLCASEHVFTHWTQSYAREAAKRPLMRRGPATG
jgi:hypothetical protein